MVIRLVIRQQMYYIGFRSIFKVAHGAKTKRKFTSITSVIALKINHNLSDNIMLSNPDRLLNGWKLNQNVSNPD